MKVEIINKKMLCWDDNEEDAMEYFVLVKVTECPSNHPFKCVNSFGGVDAYKHIKPISSSKRTIEDGLEVDDIIEDSVGNSRKILAVHGNIIFISKTSNLNHASGAYTLAELIDCNCKLQQSEEEPKEEIIELSFKDISEGKGKGIAEHLIRIKDAQAE